MPRDAGPRKPTLKQLAKQKAKDIKTRERNEATFASAVQHSKSTILDVDMRFIQDTLTQNPTWISPLAGLIRSGSLNGLLKDVAKKEETGGLRWKGKCTKWGSLPLEMASLMLKHCGVELAEDVQKDEPVVRTLFEIQFWAAKSASLPSRADIRYQSTLVKLARARMEDVGRNYIAAVNSAEAISVDRDRYNIWSLENNTLYCHVFATQDGHPRRSRSEFVPNESYLSHELPTLPDNKTWQLDDPFAVDCVISDGQHNSLFSFECASFFPTLPDMKAKWTFDLSSDADTTDALKKEIESHFLQSSFSLLKQQEHAANAEKKGTKRKASSQQMQDDMEDDNEQADNEEHTGDQMEEVAAGRSTRCTEFATSSFATIVLLHQWHQGMRKDAKWKKPAEEVSKLAGELLQGLASLFLQTPQDFSFTWDGNTLVLPFKGGSLDVDEVVLQNSLLAKVLHRDRSRFMDVLQDVNVDCTRRTIGDTRKSSSLRTKYYLLAALARAMDSSDDTHSCWTSLNVKQVMQLRSTSGYRRSSTSFRQEVASSSNATRRTLTSTLQGHAFTVQDSSEQQDEQKIKKHASMDAHRLARMERYAYVTQGKSDFLSTDILCVVVQKSSVLSAEQWKAMWNKASKKFLGIEKPVGPGHAEDRLATLSWMQDINHGLRPIGWTFGCCQSTPAGPAEDDTKAKRAPIMILCTDQEATQLAAVSFLRNKKSLWIEHVSDPAHRSHNDVALALSAAGLLKFCTWCISLYNIRYGPWQKGSWALKIQQAANRMKDNMDPSDPILLLFFPDILLDAGLSPLDDNTEEKRRSFLQTLPDMDCIRIKGTKASKSRFNSLTTAHSALDKEWSVLALVLTVVCLEHNWAVSTKDLFSQDSNQARASVPYGGSKSSAIQEAKQGMDQERKGSANSLHLMTKFVISQDNKTTARMMFQVLQPEELRCSLMLKQLRSKGMTKDYYSGWAHWSWMSTAKDHVRTLSNLEGLSRVGLDLTLARAQPPEETELVWQDSLAGQMTQLTLQILRLRAGAQLYHTGGFGATAGLVHAEEQFRRASLDFFKEMQSCIQDTHSGGSRMAKKLLEGHFSQGPISRYILADLCTTRFQSLTEDVAHVLTSIWSGLLNTKIIEDCNKVQREAEQRHSSSKDLGRLDGWKAVTQQAVVKMYERVEALSTELYHTPAAFDVAKLFCKDTEKKKIQAVRRRSDSSVSTQVSASEVQEAQLLADVTKTRDWVSHNHAEEQEVLAAFSLLMKAWRAKRWSLCEEGWCSGLLPEGHVVLAGAAPLFIVRTYRLAALAWPGKIVKDKDHEFFEFNMGVRSLFWMHSTSLDLEVLRLRVVSPLRRSTQGSHLNNGIVFLVDKKMGTLDFHAEQGVDAGHQLAVAAMLNMDNSLVEEDVVQRILARHQTDKWMPEVDDKDLEAVVRDTLLIGEQDKVCTMYKNAVSDLDKDFWKAGQDTRRRKTQKAEKDSKKLKQQYDRVYAKLNATTDELVKSMVPDTVQVWTDPKNGRWKVSYKTAVVGHGWSTTKDVIHPKTCRHNRKDLRDEYTRKARQGYQENRVQREEFRQAKHTEVPPASFMDRELPDVAESQDFDGRGIFRYTAEDPLVQEKHMGRGTYGEIFACTYQGLKLALKVAVRTPDRETALLDVHQDGLEKTWDLTREFTLLSQVGPHPNVLRLYALLTSSTGHTGILMERASCDLLKATRDLKTDDLQDGVPWSTRRAQVTTYFRQTLAALTFVHSKNIVHLDVKTNNFLVFLLGERVVLSDFGFCRALPLNGKAKVRADEVYTTYYRPIECLYSGDGKVEIGPKADMWALGVVTWDCYAKTTRSLFTPDPKGFVKHTPTISQALVRFQTAWRERARDLHLLDDDIAAHVFGSCFTLEQDRRSSVDLLKDLQGRFTRTIQSLDEEEEP
ncbi:Cdk12 [Symbiodinium sp. CCMP2592]|nr:Cdk12 [Symbiodinium sp. CCMP2592]